MKNGIRNIYALLKNYQPLYAKELIYKQMMLELISFVLLMHHTKLDKWFQLGGHCDGDPDVINVAIKEASEESGIKNIKPLSLEIFDIDIHLIPPHK